LGRPPGNRKQLAKAFDACAELTRHIVAGTKREGWNRRLRRQGSEMRKPAELPFEQPPTFELVINDGGHRAHDERLNRNGAIWFR
jgi:hypothetical protein